MYRRARRLKFSSSEVNRASRVAGGSPATAAETDRASEDPPRDPMSCRSAAVEITVWLPAAIARRRLALWQAFRAAAEQVFRPVLSLGSSRGRRGGSDSTKPAPADEAARHQELARSAAAARAERRRRKRPMKRVAPKDSKGNAVGTPPRQSQAQQPPPSKPSGHPL
jgi:hypothetical protein